ncbi:MAG: bifunctional nuclease family protein [Candidatus Symbiothrix sp.]|jgi:bifunctional DNase/RNase|nr:bifunctional nuclease family protein [Candidatus Symbiothrix sp.]
MDSDKVYLRIAGITFSQVQAGAYALVLAEVNGIRRVPIIIGTPEAQSIAIFLEKLNPPRPLTHDLFISFAKLLNIQLKEVFIYKYEDGIFFSELIFTDGIKNIRLDSRTSDAIALAVRTDAAIYTTEAIMKEVSIEMEEDNILDDEIEKDLINRTEKSLENKNLEELQQSLDESIVLENYEKASFIRDLINRKKDQEDK